MKKTTFAVITLIILLTAQQVSASNDHANEHANNNPGTAIHEEHENEHANSSPNTNAPTNTTVSVTPTQNKGNDNDDYKNHGEYVSGVAHTHPGGSAVSEAAKSSIGKHHEDNDMDDDDNISLTPTVTPSETPTATPSVTPSETPSVTPSETPTATPSETLTPTPTETPDTNSQVQTILDQINGLIETIKNLLHLS